MTGNADAAAMPPPPPLDPAADVAGAPAFGAPPAAAAAAPATPTFDAASGYAVAPPVAWGAPAAPTIIQRPVPGVAGLEYAGAVPRAAAFILDGLLVGILSFVGIVLLTALGMPVVVSSILAAIVDLAYFVWGWTRSGRGTLAMGLFKLQIGRLADGARLQPAAALGRWLALRGWVTLLALVPGIGNLPSGLSLLWLIILLVSVVADARRLGIHDKLAGTAIARPAGSSDTGAWVVILLFSLLPLFAIVALIFLGSQVSNILSNVGNSI